MYEIYGVPTSDDVFRMIKWTSTREPALRSREERWKALLKAYLDRSNKDGLSRFLELITGIGCGFGSVSELNIEFATSMAYRDLAVRTLFIRFLFDFDAFTNFGAVQDRNLFVDDDSPTHSRFALVLER